MLALLMYAPKPGAVLPFRVKVIPAGASEAWGMAVQLSIQSNTSQYLDSPKAGTLHPSHVRDDPGRAARLTWLVRPAVTEAFHCTPLGHLPCCLDGSFTQLG